jgi:CBS domain-containing protein
MTFWDKAVGDVMSRGLISVAESASLTEASRILDENQINGLPVVDDAGSLVGVLSQTDLVRARASQQLQDRWSCLAVSELMTKPAITISPAASLGEAARLMEVNRVHRLVVINDEATPIGVISASDLVRVLAGNTDA